MVTRNAAVRSRVLNWDAVAQHFVKSAVRLRDRGRTHAENFSQRLLAGVFGYCRIQAPDGLTQTADEDNITKRIALSPYFPRRDE
jgi:hypothetical protein